MLITDLCNTHKLEEIENGIFTPEEVLEKAKTGELIILNGKQRSVGIGNGLLVKVNTSIGLNGIASKNKIENELTKVKTLEVLDYGPDLIMDLSIRNTTPPMYELILEEFGGPVGTLPHYLCYEPKKGINPDILLKQIEKQAKVGIAFMTLHPTPEKKLYEHAINTRLTACTSRGGGLVIDDLLLNRRKRNVIADIFDEILEILKKYGVAVSVGTAFRPANIIDALDDVHLEEYRRQKEFIDKARNNGVQVMMEGLGHIRLGEIIQYVNLIKKYKVPFMPLGPIPTDAAIGEDHIANAIGASYMALLGGAHVLNSITREEHTGKVPSFNSIMEGLKAARIAAHSVNISLFPVISKIDKNVAENRSLNYTCVVEGGIFTKTSKRQFSMGCSRCGIECPLLINQANIQRS